MRARFLSPQPPVRLVEKAGKVYVFLCLNEQVFEESYEDSGPASVYEYDYNEFVEDAGSINTQDVQEYPEKFLHYTPEPETLESKLKKLTAQINALAAAQLDMAAKEVQHV